MSSTDPAFLAFLAFFAGAFQRRLSSTEIPGLPGASWDRKAAWLLWSAERPAAADKPAPGSAFD
ncbi:hypothetical protein NPA31_011750 [Aurantimonas sp. MSK8Z-1]|uniref:hypothetical protein n=1 Tax=Mangrovibrevibacter kandeliae TaxID=2968473 RepID=UPI002119026B|nr:hypothetical protein [Aurantimonas sp. MSK8Z-1]MCW4115637.1 hypothetical protein [Aurantimonas sp. MSK8Z-1]